MSEEVRGGVRSRETSDGQSVGLRWVCRIREEERPRDENVAKGTVEVAHERGGREVGAERLGHGRLVR